MENVKTEDSTAQRSTPKSKNFFGCAIIYKNYLATPANIMPTTSSSTGIGFGQSGLSSFGFPSSLATAQLNPLHQAFLNNPELAMKWVIFISRVCNDKTKLEGFKYNKNCSNTNIVKVIKNI